MVNRLTGRLGMVGTVDLGSVTLQPLPRSPRTGSNRREFNSPARYTLPRELDANDGGYDAANHAAITRCLPSIDSTPARAFPTYDPADYRLSKRVDGVRRCSPRA